jgi:inorganic pyrophosphatase/exopolyphosphatase
LLKIDKLKKYPIIYIIGHKNMDADTIISSYLLSKILNNFGIRSEYAKLEDDYEIVFDDYDLIKDFLGEKYNPTTIKNTEISNNYFILVDHNNPIQSIGDINRVVGIVDHHFTDNNNTNCLISNYASTSSFIYDMYKDVYQFSKHDKLLVFLAILSDTAYLKTTRFKEKDKKMLEILNNELNLDHNELREKYFRTNEFDKGIEINFHSNYKQYKFENIEFESSFIRANSLDKYRLNDYINYLKSVPNNWLLIWYEYDKDKTYVYFKHNNEIKEFEYDFIASRANDIVKEIIKL